MAVNFTLTTQMKIREKAIAMSENNGWISVKERMPDDGQNVLILSNNSGVSLANWTLKEGWDTPLMFCDNEWITMYFDFSHLESHKRDVTHWMPLPKPPQEK